MSHRLAITVFPALLLTHSLHLSRSLSRCEGQSKIKIASTISTPNHPTTIFIHGLDSSKETWSGVINDLTSSGYPAIAIDLRGHGESPFGTINKEEFSSKMLSDDIINFIEELRFEKPVVMVGHSMGGRILIDILANEVNYLRNGQPRRISAAIIEDIDVRTREGPSPSDEEISSEELNKLENLSHEEGGRLWKDWESFYNYQLSCI